MKRLCFVSGLTVGLAVGVLVTLVWTAPPAEEVERARVERQKTAVRTMVGALQAYEQTLNKTNQ
jgi:hypothetical protein